MTALKPYPSYKPSGIEWLGDIPVGWECKKLKLLASLNDETLGEKTPQDYEFEYVDIGSVSLVEGIKEKSSFTFESSPSRARRIVKTGDTILSTVRTYLKAIAYIDTENKDVIVSTGFAVVRPRKIFGKYLNYFIKSNYFIDVVMSQSVGISYPAINSDEVGFIQVCCPNLPEQTRIAAFLDAECGKIDALIAKSEKMIALLDEKRQAVITHYVTKGTNPTAPLKPSGIDWIGDIPEWWTVKKLKYIANLRSGESITSETIDAEGAYPVYGGNGFRGYTTNYTHNGNYVLIGRQGAWCGNINYASGEFWASEHAVVVSIIRKDLYRWLGELLTIMNLNQHSLTAAQPGLAVDFIKNIDLPTPPLPEQVEIVQAIETQTAKIDTLKAKIIRQVTLLKERKTSLITAAVTGKIDVRDVST